MQAMGTATAEQLRAQTGQLERIHEDVENLEDVLKLADKQMRQVCLRLLPPAGARAVALCPAALLTECGAV